MYIQMLKDLNIFYDYNKNLFIKVDIQDLDFVLNEDDFSRLINRINFCLDSIDKKNATLQ